MTDYFIPCACAWDNNEQKIFFYLHVARIQLSLIMISMMASYCDGVQATQISSHLLYTILSLLFTLYKIIQASLSVFLVNQTTPVYR